MGMEYMEGDNGSRDTMDTINTLWLKNIYENLKNLENYERLARTGCTSLEIYAEIVSTHTPREVSIIMNNIQIQNLKNIVGEMHLLLTDLTPILDTKILDKFHGLLDDIEKGMKLKNYLLIESRSIPRDRLIQTELTGEFYNHVDILAKMRRMIIKDIEGILYSKTTSKESNKKLDALRAEYG